MTIQTFTATAILSTLLVSACAHRPVAAPDFYSTQYGPPSEAMQTRTPDPPRPPWYRSQWFRLVWEGAIFGAFCALGYNEYMRHEPRDEATGGGSGGGGAQDDPRCAGADFRKLYPSLCPNYQQPEKGIYFPLVIRTK